MLSNRIKRREGGRNEDTAAILVGVEPKIAHFTPNYIASQWVCVKI
jgi:hypothetical protein